jgi:lysophospholipase L1-like esterase
LVLATWLSNAAGGAEPPLNLRDGDLIVFLGNTLIEREQRYGYWETALTIRNPDKALTFRNMGWSGDTVWGEARAGFDTPREGFERLVAQTLALKPTVIVLGYGSNESFAGEEGLPRFEEGLNRLLDRLGPAKARLALLAPLPFETLPPPLPNMGAHNRHLDLYRAAIKDIAARRRVAYLDLLELLEGPPLGRPGGPLSDNGVHLTETGYWRTGLAWWSDLPAATWRKEITLNPAAGKTGVTLPILPYPAPGKQGTLVEVLSLIRPTIQAGNLPPTEHKLLIDGREAMTAAGEAWAGRVPLLNGPDVSQVERLRALIVAKNREYFHRWRPQNETYLFGFRKHEQGQHAREVPLFDPIVAEFEKEIARVKKPLAHTYELVPVK